MVFTVKSTYKDETRKFFFPDSTVFPSFIELYNQLYRLFPHLSHSFYLSKLLFSPDSSDSRILVSKQIHTAEQYREAVSAPSLRGPWSNPTLRFDVHDEIPTKLPKSLTAHQTPWSVTWREPPALEPVGDIALPTFSPFVPPPPPAPFPASSGFRSAGNFMDSNWIPPQSWTAMSPSPSSTTVSSPVQHQPTNCCAVAQATQDVRQVIDTFKGDLDRIITRLGTQDLTQPPTCVEHDCASCGQIFSGPWLTCSLCQLVICRSCRWTQPSTCGSTILPHRWDEKKCVRCPVDAPRTCPIPFIPPPMPPPPLPSFPNTFIPPPPVPLSNPPIIPRMNGYSGHMWPVSPIVPPAPPIPREEPQAPVHSGIVCDACDQTIRGVRHKCLDCSNYDLCTTCINDGAAERHDPFHEFFDLNEPGRVVVHVVNDRDHANFAPAPTPAPAPASPAVHFATCDLCDSRIHGDRFKCANCPDFDTCSSCFTIVPEQHPGHTFLKLSKQGDVISPSSPHIVQQHSAACNVCRKTIFGVRYKCMHHECPDFDLCEHCEAHPISVHPANHPLLKMRSPDTVIPTVYRVGATTLIDVEERARPPSRLSTPLSYRTPSRSLSPMPWFQPPPTVQQQSIPGQFPFGIRSPTPPPLVPPSFSTASSPPPLPPKSHLWPKMRATTWPELQSSTSVQGASYNPVYIPAAPQIVPPPPHPQMPIMRFGYSPPVAFETPVMLGNDMPPLSIPPPTPDIPSFYRHDWNSRSSTASPAFTASPVAPAATDLVERAIANFPPVVPHPSLWTNSASSGVLSSPPNVPYVLRSSPERTPHPVEITSVGPSYQPIEVGNFGRPTNTYRMPESPPISPIHEEAFLTPISEHNQLPLLTTVNPSETSPTTTTTTYRAHSLADLLNAFPPRSRFSVSDVSNKDTQSQSELTRTLETPVQEGIEPKVTLVDSASTVSEAPSELPIFSADFVEDITVMDGQVFPPGAEFVKSWRMRNTGSDWDETTELIFVAGESFGQDKADVPIHVGSLKSGEEIDLYTWELKAPDNPGRYVGYWRLKNSTCHLFGASIWIDITVAEHSDSNKGESSLSSSSVIVMPAAPGLPEVNKQIENLSLSTTVAVTAASGSSNSDAISLDGTESSFSGASLLSSPLSDDDWEEGRANVPGPSTASGQKTKTSDYVVLYDDNSSEDGI